MLSFFKELPINRKFLIVLAIIQFILILIGLTIRFFFPVLGDWAYGSIFQITLAYYSWVFGVQYIILFIAGLIMDFDVKYEFDCFKQKDYNGVSIFGVFIMIQVFLSFITIIQFMDGTFEKVHNSEYGNYFLLKNSLSVGDWDYILLLLVTSATFISVFLPHLFRRNQRILNKMGFTEKKIDELSEKVKELTEQLKNK